MWAVDEGRDAMGDQEAAEVAIVEHASLGFFSSATAAVLFAVQSNHASA